jgi:hypothetical protein
MTNSNYRASIVQNQVNALGRKADALVKASHLASVTASTNIILAAGLGFTQGKVNALHAAFGDAHVYDSGGKNYVWVGSRQFQDLLTIDGFKNADYIGPNEMPIKNAGLVGKFWMGFYWYTWDSLTKVATTRKCIAYNESAMGFATGMAIKTLIDWVPTKVSTLIDSIMRAGSCAINADGIWEIDCTE